MTTSQSGLGDLALAAQASIPPAPGAPTTDNSVSKPTARYNELQELRDLPRTLMGGTMAMRAAGEKYMPKHPSETQGTYDIRLGCTTLFGAFKDAVTRQSAKLFIEPIILKDDVPQQIKDLCENIDGQGRGLTPFCSDLLKEAMVDGIAYIFVDFPKMAPNSTQADVIKAKARPYWRLVKAAMLIGWPSEDVGGQQILKQIRLYEVVDQPDGEFGTKKVEQIRVIDAGRFRIYTKTIDTGGNVTWPLTGEGAMATNYVPLVPVYTNRVAFMEGEPPLASLADLCAEHWVSSSEQRHALTFSRFAMLKVTGVTEGSTDSKIVVGADKVLTLPIGADAGYIEHTGAGIASGREDLVAIETRMASVGMQLRIENAGAVTATASAIDSGETNAAMKAVSKSLENAIEKAFQMTADFLSLPKGGSVEVYDEFAEEPPPGDLPMLLAMRAAREMSRMTFWNECKRRHILDDDFDEKEEAAALAAEPPPLVATPLAGGTPGGMPPVAGKPPVGAPGGKGAMTPPALQ